MGRMEIADVATALEKVRQFITLLEQNEQIWDAAGSMLSNPRLKQSDGQIHEQLPLIVRIAARADAELAAKLKEDSYGWPYHRTIEASRQLAGLLGTMEEADRILGPVGLKLAAGKGADTSNGWLVFVSHSGTDTWVARQIARAITECGATPFLDEAEIEVGADFEEDILAFLQRAHELVVLLTPWALDRPYVWAELGAAWGRQIPIVALLLGLSPTELQERARVPILLKRRNIIPLNDIDRYIEELRKRVQSYAEATT
jgi:hypothetical protein